MTDMSTKLSLILVISSAFFILGGCKGGSSSGSGDPATVSVTVSVKSNQLLSGHPHRIDYYIPSNATAAIVFLHGGGGKKEGFANSLGLKNDNSTANYDLSSDGQTWLKTQKVIAVFPQGQNVAGANWTWNNYVMNSGEDDVAFLQDLVASIRADSTLSAVTKVYIVGHSNGGMMANRMWCESPSTFDAYVALAGPPSTHLNPSGGSNPCSPSTVKPYLGIVGDHDTVLKSTNNMAVSTWTINSFMVSNAAAWADTTPMIMNDKLFHSTRVTLKCSGSVASGVTSGQITTYSDCGGSIQMKVIAQATVSGSASGGDHCLGSAIATCTTTLVGATGLDPKTAAMTFLKSY